MTQKKILYIVRHAKSSWDFPGRADSDRPLAERGIQNAYDMAQRLKKRGDIPGFIISSPANRALHTAIIFAGELNIPLALLRVNEDLYMAGEDAISAAVAEVDNNIESLMIFGHNPDFTGFANTFLRDQIYNIPTCGMVRIDFEVSGWENIHRSKLVDYFFDYPKRK